MLHITGSVPAAPTVRTRLGVDSAGARAQGQPVPTPPEPRSPLTVREDDPTVVAETITFKVNGAELLVYLVLPNFGATPVASIEGRPTATPLVGPSWPQLIMVCHENRGLSDHIRDVTRRLARASYAAAALGLLSWEGGAANVPDPAQISDIPSRADPSRHVVDPEAVATYFAGQRNVNAETVGMIGRCFGGGITWAAATDVREPKAAVAWCGQPPLLDQVPNITAVVLSIYSSDRSRRLRQ
ncbi:MAG: dienelactone hydrolase family protein [Chloroflexota bacterium]|nr:dienelactone hydrolase family protein [Chloroflexota bacterium]